MRLSAIVTLAHAGCVVAGWRFWPGPFSGLSSVTHIISFGDSYTQTGFDTSGPWPSEANPFGNPGYPGRTSSNGPNWIDFLTTTWNRTFVKTLNFAYGGATLDNDIIPTAFPTISLKEQINKEFVPLSKRSEDFDWQPSNTLFAIFIGINDIDIGHRLTDKERLYEQEMLEYAQLLETLYQTGARNFVLLNVPPLDRDPQTIEAGEAAINSQKTDVAAWNAQMSVLVKDLNRKQDVTAFLFDTNALFNKVIDDPCSYPETCALKDTASYCPMYAFGTPTWYTKDEKCDHAVDEYFWLNTLHPTFRIHNVTAREITNQLSIGNYWWT